MHMYVRTFHDSHILFSIDRQESRGETGRDPPGGSSPREIETRELPGCFNCLLRRGGEGADTGRVTEKGRGGGRRREGGLGERCLGRLGEGLRSAPRGLSRARIYTRVVFLPPCFSVNKRSSMDRPVPWRGVAWQGTAWQPLFFSRTVLFPFPLSGTSAIAGP